MSFFFFFKKKGNDYGEIVQQSSLQQSLDLGCLEPNTELALNT